MLEKQSVCWLPALKEEGYASMDRYWLEFQTWVASQEDLEFSFKTLPQIGRAPEVSIRGTRINRGFNKYFRYPSSVKGANADIFHILDHSYAHLIPYIRSGGKVIATVFDLVPFEDSSGLSKVQVDRFRKTVSHLKKAHHLISISQETKVKLNSMLGIPLGNITVAIPGMDFQRFNTKVDPKNPIATRLRKKPTIILSVGSNANRKNLRSLLPIFAELKKNSDVGQWVFVRAGELLPEETRKDFENILGDSFIELGRTFGTDLIAAYQAASIFIFPSTLEGLTFTIPEAMAAGCAIVTNRCTANPEAAGDAAHYYDEGDFKAAALILERLIREPNQLLEASNRSIERARLMTWERHFESVIAVYRNFRA